MIVGTAGHIDHGKTALIAALTGVSGDRLKEEQARGITIDLGFAYLPFDADGVLGFVDVPGHERFVHAMVAGVASIDFSLLVVAADDGPMPQTREHLAILDLLQVRRGIVALTKSDLSSPQQLTKIKTELRDMLAGTTLEHAEIVSVSARTGAGVDALRERLIEAARDWNVRGVEGRFRLAVDRVFTLTGIGLVVTGTVLSGQVRREDFVTVSPKGIVGRVRSVHAQNRPVEIAHAGDRCAVNLTGPDIEKKTIQRGDVLMDPSLHAPTDRVDAHVRVLSGALHAVGSWHPARLHIGSAEVGARLVPLEKATLDPGAEAFIQLILDRPIAAAALDRFILRDATAQRTIGGGVLVDLRAPARHRRTSERHARRNALAVADPQRSFASLLDIAPFAWDATAFLRDRALSRTALDTFLQGPDVVTVRGESGASVVLNRTRWDAFVARVIAALDGFHADNPDVQGMSGERLRGAVAPMIATTAFRNALDHEDFAGCVVIDGAFVRRASFTVTLRAEQDALWNQVAPLLNGESRFRPPRVRDVAGAVARSESDIRHLMKRAARAGLADEIALDHFFLRATTNEMMQVAVELTEQEPQGRFTAAQFRDRLNNGRKVAIQILEFFDRQRITRKQGTERKIQPGFVVARESAKASSTELGRESFPVGRPDFKSG